MESVAGRGVYFVVTMAKHQNSAPEIPHDRLQALRRPVKIETHAAQERVRAEQERQRARVEKARNRFVHATELAHILSDWFTLVETGEIGRISREDLRRVDMHVACADPRLVDHLRKADETRAFFAVLDQEVAGNTSDPMPGVIENPYQYLNAAGVVEQGCNERTAREHARIRLGVEVAANTADIKNFLHILDTQIGIPLAAKLTGYDRAILHDQLENLLKSRAWPHPTQETAESFVAWERIFGNERAHAQSYTLRTEKPNFKKATGIVEPSRQQPTHWENLTHAPGNLIKLIFDEDGARTRQDKKKE